MTLATKKPAFANTFLFVTVCIWGSLVPITALLTEKFDPYFISLVRYALAVPFLFLLIFIFERGKVTRQGDRVSLKKLMLLGLPMAGFTMFYTLGVAYSNPISAAVILTLAPIIAAILGKILNNTALARGFIPAVILGIIGSILVISFRPGADFGTFSLQGGEIFLVLAQACWSFYSFKSLDWMHSYSQIRMTAHTSAASSVWLIFIFIIAIQFDVAFIPTEWPDVAVVSQFLWISWAAAGLAIIFWHRGARALGVPMASLYINLIPFIAILVSFIFLDIIPAAMQVLGGLVVIAGVLQIQLRQLWSRGTKNT